MQNQKTEKMKTSIILEAEIETKEVSLVMQQITQYYQEKYREEFIVKRLEIILN